MLKTVRQQCDIGFWLEQQTGERHLVGREVGRKLLNHLEDWLAQGSARAVISLDCTGIEIMDVTGADECFGKLMMRLQAEDYGEVYFLFSVNASQERLLHVILGRRRVQAIIDDALTQRLVGWCERSIRTAWDLLQQQHTLTARDVADHKGVDITSASGKVIELWKRHLAMRESQNCPSGGIEYTYYAVPRGA